MNHCTVHSNAGLLFAKTHMPIVSIYILRTLLGFISPLQMDKVIREKLCPQMQIVPFKWSKPLCSDLGFEPVHEISDNLICATSKASDQPAHTRSPIRAFASRLSFH